MFGFGKKKKIVVLDRAAPTEYERFMARLWFKRRSFWIVVLSVVAVTAAAIAAVILGGS